MLKVNLYKNVKNSHIKVHRPTTEIICPISFSSPPNNSVEQFKSFESISQFFMQVEVD
jgi:hypothetical protein